MVRLKAAARMQGGCVAVFQFHYGTIKSMKNYSEKSLRNLFQFHYGTIKSLIVRPVCYVL